MISSTRSCTATVPVGVPGRAGGFARTITTSGGAPLSIKGRSGGLLV